MEVLDAAEALYDGEDYWVIETCGGSGRSGQGYRGGLARDRCDGQYELLLAQGIWRSGDGSGAVSEGAGGRERASQAGAVADLTLDNLILKEVSLGKF